MNQMIFRSPRGKEIIFDDFEDNTEEYGSYWVEMCPHCHNKYRSILGHRADEGGTAAGACSVVGCENEANVLDNLDDYYVWKRLAKLARDCTGTRCISNNDNTRDAEDKAYELLDQFEKEHSINTEASIKLG